MRTPIVAGNWKMNLDREGARRLAQALVDGTPGNGVQLIVAPPTIYLSTVAEVLTTAPILLASQNVHWAASGPYTGEVSTTMLLDLGCRYAIIGHSERREHFQESDELLNRKIRSALDQQIHPIICVGESLEGREGERTREKVEFQVRAALVGVSAEAMQNVVIAYEPIWAIGTGKTASPQQAQEVHAFIRTILEDLYGRTVAQATRILYGGSVKPTNFPELIGQEDIDGGLVGGGSLSAESFLSLARQAMAS
ncbi:MAG: triose-phosphate isomerase [Bradymonadaceae bacterium]